MSIFYNSVVTHHLATLTMRQSTSPWFPQLQVVIRTATGLPALHQTGLSSHWLAQKCGSVIVPQKPALINRLNRVLRNFQQKHVSMLWFDEKTMTSIAGWPCKHYLHPVILQDDSIRFPNPTGIVRNMGQSRFPANLTSNITVLKENAASELWNDASLGPVTVFNEPQHQIAICLRLRCLHGLFRKVKKQHKLHTHLECCAGSCFENCMANGASQASASTHQTT